MKQNNATHAAACSFEKRNKSLDVLRCIGLLCIVLAHVGPPDILFRIRNFDVVLMVIIMGWSYILSSATKSTPYNVYIAKRFKRLVIPTWIFITVYYIFVFIISLLRHETFIYDLKSICINYFTFDRFGYIWIMRVYFYMAICLPVIFKYSKKIKSEILFWSILIFVYILYEVLFLIVQNAPSAFRWMIDITALQFIGWAFVAAIAVRTFNSKKPLWYIIVFSSLFVVLGVYFHWDTTQHFKYPPKMYYISYGVSITLILKYIFDKINIKNISLNLFIKYISKESLGIYFWHIIILYILKFFSLGGFGSFGFAVKYFIVLVGSICANMLQQGIIRKFKVIRSDGYHG